MDIPVRAILDWVVRWKVALAIALGILLRLVSYGSGRGYWMDEASLAQNLRTLTPTGFFGPLLRSQLAPPGFLVVVWSSGQCLGDNIYAFRLIPLLGGIAGLFLFREVARRCTSPEAVFPAVLLFGVAHDLVYYASELKQYSTDVALALACLLMGLTVGSRPLTWLTGVVIASFGALVVWFSHPSIFVLTSVGIVGLGRALAARDGRSAGLWLVVGLVWLGSFAGVHEIANRQMDGSDQMWRFWDFAFPPIPPRSVWDASWIARRLAYSFINPLNFDFPFGPRVSMVPALGLALVGTVRLWRLDRARFALLFLPVVATLAASTLHLYPFHGRLILFLAPIALIAIAAGLATVGEVRGRGLVYYGLAVLVLAGPVVVAIGQAIAPEWSHNRFGDLHPTNLDPYRFPL